MKQLYFLALLLACVPAHTSPPVEPTALKGVTLGIPEPADARETPGIGCGLVVSDLALRSHKQLVTAFSDAGAEVTNSDRAAWVLTIAIREASMGPENTLPRREAHEVRQGDPNLPPPDAPQQSLFNGGNDNAQVVLDVTLAHDGEVRWREIVSGHAKSAPCVQAYDKVREAMRDAVEQIRAAVIPRVRP